MTRNPKSSLDTSGIQVLLKIPFSHCLLDNSINVYLTCHSLTVKLQRREKPAEIDNFQCAYLKIHTYRMHMEANKNKGATVRSLSLMR